MNVKWKQRHYELNVITRSVILKRQMRSGSCVPGENECLFEENDRLLSETVKLKDKLHSLHKGYKEYI
jgi:hypothetical protein